MVNLAQAPIKRNVSNGFVNVSLTAGNGLILSYCNQEAAGATAISSITDTNGNTWLQTPGAYVFSNTLGTNQRWCDIWYCAANKATGLVTITIHLNGTGGASNTSELYEMVGTVAPDAASNTAATGTVGTPAVMTSASITAALASEIFVSIANQSNIFGTPTVNSPWTEGPYDPSLDPGPTAYVIGAGAQQAVFTFAANWNGTTTTSYVTSSAVFSAAGSSPTPPPVSGLQCAPTDPSGNLTSGVYISDLGLFIGPATALYKTPVIPALINAYETTNEGRHAIVLDFTQGAGLYARDLGTVLEWPTKNNTVVYVWQPTIIPMPEGIYGRATDWMGGQEDLFIQGVRITADTFNAPKTFVLQSQDDQSLNVLNETPATFNGQSTKSFSCVTPFIAHGARVISTDGVEWRIWQTELVAQPFPAACDNWQTEQVSLGITGWAHARELNVAYISLTPLTVTLTFDAWPTIVLTLPSSAGLQVKTKLTLPPNKWKLIGFQISSTNPFRLFAQDFQAKVKEWGSAGAYQVVKPIGGTSRVGATV